jgi:hypothetical protein
LLQQPVRRKYFVLHHTFALHFFIIVATIGQEEKFFAASYRFTTSGQERNTSHSSLLLPPIHIQGLIDC